MEITQSTSLKVPARIKLSSDGSAKTGLVYSQVTVYIQKQNGSSTQLVLSSGAQWVEVDSTNMPGVYDLLLAAGDTDTLGFLKYTIAATGCDRYYGLLEVIPPSAPPANWSSLNITNSGLVSVGTNFDKTGYLLSSVYDPAKTAAQAGDQMGLTTVAVDLIWDEPSGDHVVAGTIGKKLYDLAVEQAKQLTTAKFLGLK